MRTQRRIGVAVLTTASLFIAAGGLPPAQAQTTVPAPADVQVANLGYTTVGLSWEGPPVVPYQTEHRIEYHEASQPDDVQTVDPGFHQNLEGRHTGSVHLLEVDTTYVFHVIRIEDSVESEPSEPVTVTTRSPAPTDLEVKYVQSVTVHLAWEGQGTDPYRIYWHEAGDPSSLQSMDVRHGSVYPGPIGVDGSVSGLSPSTTYVLWVVHIGDDGEESEPSNQVTAMTAPYDPPSVDVDVDGNDVTLTWSRPPHQVGHIVYDIYDNGVLETRLRTLDEQPQVTISRATPGTHIYTIDGKAWGGQLTAPVTVTIPPSQDTTPPTAPVVKFGPDCVTFEDTIRIEEQSTDDTTPQSEIRYEGLTRIWVNPGPTLVWYVYDYDFPLSTEQPREFSHPGVPGVEDGMTVQVRAVDEAGNRSDPVTPEEVIPDC